MFLLVLLGICVFIGLISFICGYSRDCKREKLIKEKKGKSINEILDAEKELRENSRVQELLSLLVDTCNKYQHEMERIDIYNTGATIYFPKTITKPSVDKFSANVSDIEVEERKPIGIEFIPYDVKLPHRIYVAAFTHLVMQKCPYLEYRYFNYQIWEEKIKKSKNPIQHEAVVERNSRTLENAMFYTCNYQGESGDIGSSYSTEGVVYPHELYNSNIQTKLRTRQLR